MTNAWDAVWTVCWPVNHRYRWHYSCDLVRQRISVPLLLAVIPASVVAGPSAWSTGESEQKDGGSRRSIEQATVLSIPGDSDEHTVVTGGEPVGRQVGRDGGSLALVTSLAATAASSPTPRRLIQQSPLTD